MKDQSGNLYIADALMALGILFLAIFMLNTVITIPDQSLSHTTLNSKNSQDIMEILSGKVDFEDNTFISKISGILDENDNSQQSITEVSTMCNEKFSELNLNNYRFTENNVLNNKVLANSGDYSHAENMSVATRTFGDYSYTLYMW